MYIRTKPKVKEIWVCEIRWIYYKIGKYEHIPIYIELILGTKSFTYYQDSCRGRMSTANLQLWFCLVEPSMLDLRLIVLVCTQILEPSCRICSTPWQYAQFSLETQSSWQLHNLPWWYIFDFHSTSL